MAGSTLRLQSCVGSLRLQLTRPSYTCWQAHAGRSSCCSASFFLSEQGQSIFLKLPASKRRSVWPHQMVIPPPTPHFTTHGGHTYLPGAWWPRQLCVQKTTILSGPARGRKVRTASIISNRSHPDTHGRLKVRGTLPRPGAWSCLASRRTLGIVAGLVSIGCLSASDVLFFAGWTIISTAFFRISSDPPVFCRKPAGWCRPPRANAGMGQGSIPCAAPASGPPR